LPLPADSQKVERRREHGYTSHKVTIAREIPLLLPLIETIVAYFVYASFTPRNYPFS
jgi:hypothetical protein